MNNRFIIIIIILNARNAIVLQYDYPRNRSQSFVEQRAWSMVHSYQNAHASIIESPIVQEAIRLVETVWSSRAPCPPDSLQHDACQSGIIRRLSEGDCTPSVHNRWFRHPIPANAQKQPLRIQLMQTPSQLQLTQTLVRIGSVSADAPPSSLARLPAATFPTSGAGQVGQVTWGGSRGAGHVGRATWGGSRGAGHVERVR